MANQKLISYLKKAQEANMTKEETESQLLDADWKQEQIDAAFDEVEWTPPSREKSQMQDETQTTEKQSAQARTARSADADAVQKSTSSGSQLVSIILGILIIAILGVGGMFAYAQFSPSVTFKGLIPFLNQTESVSTSTLPAADTTDSTSATTTFRTSADPADVRMRKESAKSAIKKSYQVFAKHLKPCTKLEATFLHPLTGDKLKRRVLGIINGKCRYIEQMPGGEKMTCNLSESARKDFANYYERLAEKWKGNGSVSFSFSMNEEGVSAEATGTISGNEEEEVNPLRQALDSGACSVSRYGSSEFQASTTEGVEMEINSQ